MSIQPATVLDPPPPAELAEADAMPAPHPVGSIRPRGLRSAAPPAALHGAVLRAETSLAAVIDLADRRAERTSRHPARPAHHTETPAPAAALPDPTSLSCAIVRTAVEVLRGERSIARMARWVSPDILGALHRRARLTTGGAPCPPGLAPVTIVRTRTVRIGDRAAEATVIVRDRGRVRAAAVRLEAARGSWHAVALEIG